MSAPVAIAYPVPAQPFGAGTFTFATAPGATFPLIGPLVPVPTAPPATWVYPFP